MILFRLAPSPPRTLHKNRSIRAPQAGAYPQETHRDLPTPLSVRSRAHHLLTPLFLNFIAPLPDHRRIPRARTDGHRATLRCGGRTPALRQGHPLAGVSAAELSSVPPATGRASEGLAVTRTRSVVWHPTLSCKSRSTNVCLTDPTSSCYLTAVDRNSRCHVIRTGEHFSSRRSLPCALPTTRGGKCTQFVLPVDPSAYLLGSGLCSRGGVQVLGPRPRLARCRCDSTF